MCGIDWPKKIKYCVGLCEYSSPNKHSLEACFWRKTKIEGKFEERSHDSSMK